MLELVETLVGRELGGQGGLVEGLGRAKLLKTGKLNILHAALVFISNTTDLIDESIHWTHELIHA